MSKLSARLDRLEVQPGTGGQYQPRLVAIVESPFPSANERQWAIDLRKWVGSDADLVVLEGSKRKLLLPPSPREDEAEREVVAAENTYPNISVFEFIGELSVARWDSENERREAERWVDELERRARERLEGAGESL